MYFLLVTWLYLNQPPSSYQVQFASEANCEAARDKLVAEGERLRLEQTIYEAQIHALAPGVPPRVIAICSRQ